MKEVSDVELIDLVKGSDYTAFAELHRRYWKYIYEFTYRKLGDGDDAFDITQDVFIDFFERRERLAIAIPLKNYLRTAAVFKLSNHFRKKGFRERHYRDFRLFLERVNAEETPFDGFELQERERTFEELVELIHHAIEEMPQKMKEIFLMSRDGQHSISTIADSLDLSPQTVKNQISKAYSRIRAMAEQHSLSPLHLLFVFWLI